MNDPAGQLGVDRFSEREVEILGLLAKRFTNREIAQRLFLSLGTVKWYNKQLYKKLGVNSRTQAAAKAREMGLLDKAAGIKGQTRASAGHNLPAQLTSFVGREREVSEITNLLEEARLVTLTGAGGCGKTRLALRVAEATAGNYRDGATFVPLATAGDPALVAKTIAHALGVIEQPNRPLEETLQSLLRPKEMLLLLDNFEHVLAAVSLVTDLLASAPELTILATSREALRLTGEREYLVPPLTLPGYGPVSLADELTDSEAVTLFVQRARAAVPHFALNDENAAAVADICRRLDGLPLAVELAAARLKLFSPVQLLARLESRLGLLTAGPRDLPARQRTLRATLEWSHNLLDESERRLFARLSVFSNGRSVEAVEAVCGPGLAGDPLTGLESLLNKSLIYRERGPGGAPRFLMLETIHEYARERLAGGDEAEQIRDRHLAFFLSLVEAMEPGFRRLDQLSLLDQTGAEMGNLRKAFEWAMATDQVDAAARLLSVIDYYLIYRDGLVEGYRWAKRIYSRIDQLSPPYRTRFLLAAARLAYMSGEIEQSHSFIQQGVILARQQGDRLNLAWLLVEIAPIVVEESEAPGVYEEAIHQYEEALSIFREFDHKPGIAMALNSLGNLVSYIGDYARAGEFFEASLVTCYATGEIYRQLRMLGNLSYVAYRQGEFKRARELAITSVRKGYESGMRPLSLVGLAALAGPLGKLGEPENAARLLGASAAALEGMGMPYQPGDQMEVALFLADIRAQLDEATFAAAWAEGQSLTLDEAFSLAFEA